METVTYASFTQRVFARLIDMVFVGAITFGVYLLMKNTIGANNENEALLQNMTYLVETSSVIIFCMIYYPVLEAFGGTIGKRIVGIKPLDEFTLQSPSLANCLGRGIIYMVFLALMVVPSIASCLGILWSPKQQTWHDKIAGVVVVKTKQP